MKFIFSYCLFGLTCIYSNNLLSQAALDPNYGDNGITVIDFNADYDQAFDSYVYNDGRALIMGRIYVGAEYHTGISRVLPNGDPDPSFGVNGKAEFPDFSFTNGVAVRDDGKIIVVGGMNTGSSVDMVAFLINDNGTIDTSFGDNGFLVVSASADLTDSAFGAYRASNNRILLTGLIGPFQDADNCMIMIDENGDPDPSFGVNGVFIFGNAAYDDYVADVSIQNDGSLLVLSTATINGSETGLIYKFDHTGTPIDEFAINGLISLYPNSIEMGVSSIDVLSNGNVAITGTAYSGGNAITQIVMLDALGAFVSDFGTNGVATASLPGEDLYGFQLFEQWNGKLLILGLSSEFALVRLNADGSLDNTLDSDGVWIPAVHPLYESMVGGRMMSGDQLYICGSVYSGMADMIFMKFIMDDGASIDENQKTGDFRIFPNPANNNFFNVYLANSNSDYTTIQLINSLGEIVMNYPVGNLITNTFEIPSNLMNGYYTVRILANDHQLTQPLLLMK